MKEGDSQNPTTNAQDYAARIKAERQKRAWTQEYLAEKSGLSTRTIQRLECGETPSPETLRLLAATFGIAPEELDRKTTRTEFEPKTRWFSANWIFIALCLFFTLIDFVSFCYFELHSPNYQPWEVIRGKHLLYAQTGLCVFLWLNTPFLVIGYSVKNRTLRLLHWGWSGQYDLLKTTGIARCPQVDMGTLYLVPNGIVSPNGFYYNRLIGFFTGHVSYPENAVLVELGKKQVVVTPEDPDGFIVAVREQISTIAEGGSLPPPACVTENVATDADYSEKIRNEREKRGWTQEELAQRSQVSVRTVQRVEKGTPPSAETLRLVAEAFGLEVAELTKHSRRTHFQTPYTKRGKALVVTLCVLVFFAISLCPFHLQRIYTNNLMLGSVLQIAFIIWFIINLYLQVPGLNLKSGRLLIGHIGFVEKFDLKQLTGIEINPRAMTGAIPLSFPWVILTPWCHSPLLGTFRAFVTDEAHCVILEFGTKKIVVTPDDPQAFVAALREEIRSLPTQGDENIACANNQQHS